MMEKIFMYFLAFLSLVLSLVGCNFYSENKITFAVTKSGQEHIIDLSLTRLEEQLDPRRFFRANRQVIVCIDAIVHAAPYFNGRIILHVKPIHKDKITVSEEKVSSFKMWLNF